MENLRLAKQAKVTALFRGWRQVIQSLTHQIPHRLQVAFTRERDDTEPRDLVLNDTVDDVVENGDTIIIQRAVYDNNEDKTC